VGLCVDWLLAWNVVWSQAELGPVEQASQGAQMFKHIQRLLDLQWWAILLFFCLIR